MSTYRYRGTDGVIDISAHSLVTDDFSTTAFTVIGSEAISSLGMHLQWNKFGPQGSGYIINQKGAGTLGGLVLGTSTTGDVFTEGFSVYTDSAIAGISSSTGRFQITGASANAALVTAVATTLHNTSATTSTITQNCVAPGFAYHDFTNSGAQQVRLLYNSADQSFQITNAGLGPMLYQGQIINTGAGVPIVPQAFIGGIVGTNGAFGANTRVLRNIVSNAEWDNPLGLKVSLTIPTVGHYIIHAFAYIDDATGGVDQELNLVVDGTALQNFKNAILGGKSGQVMSISIPMDFTLDGRVISINTVVGGSGTATCIFSLAAQRIA